MKIKIGMNKIASGKVIIIINSATRRTTTLHPARERCWIKTKNSEPITTDAQYKNAVR